MPTYTYTCPQCGHVDQNVLVSLSKIDEKRQCGECQTPMDRQFPKKVHTISDRSLDWKNPGKAIKEKNERLKSREAGYSHEQQHVRQEVERKTQQIMNSTGK